VGLNAAPKGKWFCPFCVDSKKKKKEKQLSTILSVSTGGQTDMSGTQASGATSLFLSNSSSFDFNDKKF